MRPDWGFPDGSVVRNLAASAADSGDKGLIPGSGRSPGAGNGNPLSYSCLENPMGRKTWQIIVHRVTKSQRTEQLNTHSHTHTHIVTHTHTHAHTQPHISSVAQSCPTLCDPSDCSTPGLPLHYQLLEFTQTHVH